MISSVSFQTSNTCPIDRVKYTAVITVDSKGGLISRDEVLTPPPQDHNADFEPDDATFCEVRLPIKVVGLTPYFVIT